MKEFYAKIEVLLILSIVPETFCRVIVEAAMSEVRCLAYSKGNIPLLISDAFRFEVCDVKNVSELILSSSKIEEENFTLQSITGNLDRDVERIFLS